MFYLVEKKNGYFGYVYDTADGVVEKVSMPVFNRIIKSVEINGAGTNLNDSSPCVPIDFNVLPASRVSGACILLLNEIYTHNNNGKVTTRFAGKALLRGSAGIVALKNLIHIGLVKLRSENALSGDVSDLFEVSIIFSATGFSQLPQVYLTNYLIFNYIYDGEVDYKSVNTRLSYPYFAPKGLTSYVSMFDMFRFSDMEMTFWDLRKYLLNKYSVIRN